MPANHVDLIKRIKFFTLAFGKPHFLMNVSIEMRDPSRPVFRSRADDVVNFYAEALTLAVPVATNARGRAPDHRFFLPINRSGLAIVTGRSIHDLRDLRAWSPNAITGRRILALWPSSGAVAVPAILLIGPLRLACDPARRRRRPTCRNAQRPARPNRIAPMKWIKIMEG